MKRLRKKLGVMENVGVLDRSLRSIIGLLLNVPIVVAMVQVTPIGWEFYASAFSFYLLLTAMLGWDPIYAMLHGRTCGLSERNRCGTFTYQMDAALGHHPDHDKGYETHALKPEERVKGVDQGGYMV